MTKWWRTEMVQLPRLPIWFSGRMYVKYMAWPSQLYRPGYKSVPGCEIRSDTYAIGLIS